MLFRKYGGDNLAVINFMSHFSMFILTKDTLKLANRNKGHAQGIRIVICHITNCPIIYPVGWISLLLYRLPFQHHSLCRTSTLLTEGDYGFIPPPSCHLHSRPLLRCHTYLQYQIVCNMLGDSILAAEDIRTHRWTLQ